MAKKTWVVASDEGVDFARRQADAAEVGATVDLELSAQQEKALVAAGWVEEPKNESKSKNKEG